MSTSLTNKRSIVNLTRRVAQRLVPFLVACTALCVMPQASRADPATAEALFHEGLRLFDEGKHGEACAKFTESQRLDPSPGTMLRLGDCHEREGKLATAWAEFLASSRLAGVRGDRDMSIESKRRALQLEPVISRLTLRVERPVAGLIVKRNGQTVEMAQWGTALPVDPGKYIITAEAPRHEPFRISVHIGSKRSDAAVSVPALAMQSSDVPAKGRPVAGYVVGGLGVVSLSAGAVFGAMALSNNAKAKDTCPSFEECSPGAAIDHRDRANVMAWASNVGVGVGLLGLAVGGYMLLSGAPGPRAASGPGVRTSVALEPQTTGLRAVARF